MRASATVLAAALALGAGGRGSGLLPGPPPAATGEPALDPESTKAIAAKRATACVAADGTACAVEAAVVRATPVGRLWRCRWRRA